MDIKEVANRLCEGLEMTSQEKTTIERRLAEIAFEDNLSMEELDDLCWADSVTMFDRIWGE